MMASEPSTQLQDNDESFYDQNTIQTLKQQVCLNNHQLLELTYNDQKFYQKLKELNHHGCIHIQKLQYTEALIYLTQAEKVLEYAASCGKTIERKLIITTLNNEASLYQKAWELQKAQSYLQAIIYNISSFFENSSDNHYADKPSQFTKNILDCNTPEYQDFSISLWRKKSLVIFYLQYCAINSQNKNNQRAFSSASKAVSLIKEISIDFYRYEQYLIENKVLKSQESDQFKDNLNSKNLLLQLSCFKQIDMKKVDFEEFYKKTVKYIAVYMKRLQALEYEGEDKLQNYKKCFENYSIGTIMQINPIELDQQTDKVNLDEQISTIQKHYKAIYLSVGHFILGTEARFIAAEKFTLDENERKNSPEYKQSQIYHLSSIIILTKYLLCESGYFDHIVNSFRNHYKLDILEDARKLLQSNPDIEVNELENDPLFTSQSTVQKSKFQVEQIQEFQSDINTVQQIPQIQGSSPLQNGPLLNVQTQSSQEDNEGPVTPKQKNSRNTKSTKISKNTVSSQNVANRQRHTSKEPNTATKRSQKKYNNNNPLTKSQNRLQAQQANRMTTSQHQNKNLQKAIHLLTSREKQNKMKSNQLNQIVKSSRSKKKSDHQFMSSNKKIQLNNDKIGAERTIDRNDSRKQTIYSKRESDYRPTGLSRSKHKRIPTSNEGDRKAFRRKDSFAQLKKVKKTDNEYGIGASSRNLQQNKHQHKNSKDALNINVKGYKKNKNLIECTQKPMKMTSPELKLKKLKSPRNIKK